MRRGLQADAWVARADEVQQLVGVLADEGLDVMAGDVVPLDTVVVEVVQDREARLVVPLGGLAVVWLRLSVSAGGAPVAGVALRGRADLRSRSRPEPSVLVRRLQVRAFAAGEVALASRGPDVADASARYSLLDELIFLHRQPIKAKQLYNGAVRAIARCNYLRGFQRYCVHAMSAANVSGIQPVDFERACR